MRGFPLPPEISEERVPFSKLEGFAGEDYAEAFAVFARSCEAIVKDAAPLRPCVPVPPDLQAICARALHHPPENAAQAQRFFETHFEPCRLLPPQGKGFVTAYYEPVVEGSLVQDEEFTAPLLSRPDDLVTLNQGESLAGPDGPLQGARQGLRGLQPYPERAAIEAGGLGNLAKPLVWLKDRVEAFFVHVQGSARVRLRDGRELRLTYAGRNGHPYTSIGKLLIEEENVPLEQAGMAGVKAWIRAKGQAAGEPGAALMLRNKSYIFFALTDELQIGEGPIGGQGISLTAFRSIAVDRSIWPYGLPMWIDADIPWQSPASTRFQRLMIAQDTGSAILGAARGDLFFGTGRDAGALAGMIRHPALFTVFLPRDANNLS